MADANSLSRDVPLDLLQLARPGVQGLTPYQPGKPLAELEREYGIRDAVKLASNENPLGPSPRALAAIAPLVTELARYPDGNGFELKDALSRRLQVTPAQITLGNGSSDVLELVTRAFVGPEHEVVFSKFAFAVYPIITQAVGAKPVVVPVKNWGHDLDAMAAAITPATRLVFLANPNNPTGTWFDGEVLDRFLDRIPAHVVVVLDEAYREYVTEPDYPDGIARLDRYPNLLVTRTFSKIYGLAGLRVGYGVSNPALADLLNRVRQPFNVNSLALAAVTAALEDHEHVDRSREMNRDGLVQLRGGFDALGLDYIPSVGNFVSVDLGRPAGPVFETLLRAGVIVRPVANYAMPNHLRITVGTEAENARVLAALQQAVNGSTALP